MFGDIKSLYPTLLICYIYYMHYDVIKKYYKKDVSVIYMDTDSFLLKSNGIDIFDEFAIGPLAEFMDLSLNNFDINHPSHCK